MSDTPLRELLAQRSESTQAFNFRWRYKGYPDHRDVDGEALAELERIEALHIGLMTEADRRYDELFADCRRLQAALRESCDERRTYLMHELGCPCPAENDDARLRAALVELVACKDLNDRISAMREKAWTIEHLREVHELERDFHRRQPLAWQAARAVLKLQEGK